MEIRETPKTPSPLFGVFACLIGFCIVIWGVAGDSNRFTYGCWPVIGLGAIFILCGFQVLMVSVLHQTVNGLATAMIATFVYGIFSTMFFWAAFSKKVIFKDKNGSPATHQNIWKIVFFIIALVCAYGCLNFLFKSFVRFRNRK